MARIALEVIGITIVLFAIAVQPSKTISCYSCDTTSACDDPFSGDVSNCTWLSCYKTKTTYDGNYKLLFRLPHGHSMGWLCRRRTIRFYWIRNLFNAEGMTRDVLYLNPVFLYRCAYYYGTPNYLSTFLISRLDIKIPLSWTLTNWFESARIICILKDMLLGDLELTFQNFLIWIQIVTGSTSARVRALSKMSSCWRHTAWTAKLHTEKKIQFRS